MTFFNVNNSLKYLYEVFAPLEIMELFYGREQVLVMLDHLAEPNLLQPGSILIEGMGCATLLMSTWNGWPIPRAVRWT